jgi:hypothetical protein
MPELKSRPDSGMCFSGMRASHVKSVERPPTRGDSTSSLDILEDIQVLPGGAGPRVVGVHSV